MVSGRRIAVVLSAALVAAAALMPSTQARAGGSCDVNDIWNALQNTLSTISSSNCAGVTSDPALWAPVGLAAGVMAGVSQSQQFCQAVQNAQNQLTNLQGDGNSLVTQLGNLGVDASFLSSILDAMSSAADAMAVVQCACGLSNDITQVGGDVGACVTDALCDLQNLVHQADPGLFGSCSGSIDNVPTNCTQNPCSNTGACNPNLGNVIFKCPAGDDAPPVTQNNGPNGTIISSTLGADASGTISVESCICPAPMYGVWVTAGNYAQWPNIVDDPNCQFFMCQCPSGTTLASNSGAGQYVCVCPNGQPAQPPIKTSLNPEGEACPPSLTGPVCPQGQVALGQKCVAACTANEVRTPDGVCCNPDQVSSCGICCPAGMQPDLANGTCAPYPPAQ
jgi:hypothetical protein